MDQQRASRSRRILVPMAVACLACAALLTRVVYIQVIQHDRLSAEAEAGLEYDTTLYGRRGAILDRNGDVLVTSVSTWDLYIRAKDWRDPLVATEASEAIALKLKSNAAELRDYIASVGSGEVRFANDVEYELGKLLAESEIPGLVAQPNTRRVIPNGDLAASILGFIGQENSGLAGIEESLNDMLDGTPGQVYYERDTTGGPIPFSPIVATEPVDGRDVILTIDRNLQQLAEATLDEAVAAHDARGGTIIVMDPYSGDVYAMATLPRLKYSTLDLSDPSQLALLKNTAVTDVYEPGSVMKVITAAAAIDAGVVTPETWYHDSGKVQIYDTELKNWEDLTYGDQTMTGVLQHSINTGAVFMAQQMGVDTQMAYFERFGFRQATGIEMSGEPGEGIYREPEDDGWTPVDPATQSFGQAISVTPLQMIAAFAATINGGNLIEPRLVRGYVNPDGTTRDEPVHHAGRAISEATSAQVRSMLNQVVDPPDGSYLHPGNPRDYTAGGKSGTANVPITNGYDERHIASFIGFAPYESPRVIIMVKLDENADLETGTVAAAPYFARLADQVLAYLNVDPDEGRLVERPMTQLTTAWVADSLSATGFQLRRGESVPIGGGAADSRLVQPGDLFAAYPGENTDGNCYLDEALAAGAVAVVGNRPPEGEWPGRTIAIVPDTVAAMASLARDWRSSCRARVVGITGTVGKTTAKEFAADTLGTWFATHRSAGNFNSREGLPLALMSLRQDHDVSVLEIAMDSRGEIAELCAIARPEVGVVLNVGLTHVSKLGSVEAIREEKVSLARSLPAWGTAILNADDARVVSVAPELRCRVLTFGYAEDAGLRIIAVDDRGLDGVTFRVRRGHDEAEVRSSIPGAHTLPAAVAAIGISLALGRTLAEAAEAVSGVRSAGRMRIIALDGGIRIVDDRYNSSPASLAGALRMLGTATGGRRIALIGRMAELGEHEEAEHRRIGTLAASCCDIVAAVGEPCVALVEAARAAGLEHASWFGEKDEAAAFVASELRAGDTVLVKASRSQAFETLIPALEAAR